MRLTYLLCFDTPVGHSRHYIGSAKHLPTRLRQHHYGSASALTRELKRRGGSFKCVRTWEGNRESELKAQKNARRLCPQCNPHGFKKQKVKPTITLLCKRKFAARVVRKTPRMAENPSIQKYLPPLSRTDLAALVSGERLLEELISVCK